MSSEIDVVSAPKRHIRCHQKSMSYPPENVIFDVIFEVIRNRCRIRQRDFTYAPNDFHRFDWLLHVFFLTRQQSRTQSLQAFWSAGQRREDSGDIEFYYRRISAVKQWKPLRNSQSKKLNFFDVPRVFPALPR